jgi:hypothetical protein
MKRIEDIKKELSERDSVFLICCHVTNSNSLKLLRDLVDKIEENGYSFILSSHTSVPEDIVIRSAGFFYDRFNEKISVDPIMIFWTAVGNYKISSPYLSYGGISDETYVLGAIKNRINGNYLGYSLGYKKVHIVEYDCVPNFEDLKQNEEILSSGFDLVVYKSPDSSMLGSVFSYNLSEKTKEFNLNFNRWIENLEVDRFFSEECFFNFAKREELNIFNKEKSLQPHGIITSFVNSGRVENVLFKFGLDENLFLFLNNHGDEKSLTVYFDGGRKDIKLGRGFWSIIDLGSPSISYVHIYEEKNLVKKWDISSPEKYEKYVNCNKIELI